ncbi:DoxX family membrane protein [Candidatus Woesearchaeota archaeon]|nr:DoxX family membrane protein [Candidatus Woesearchaeota archaeon]
MDTQWLAPSILRIAVGLTYLLVGIDQIQHPENWQGYLAPWAQEFLNADHKEFFFQNGIFDAVLGGVLLLGFLTRYAAMLAVLHLVMVLLNIGYNEIAIRDLGILLSALALSLYQKTPYSIDALRKS